MVSINIKCSSTSKLTVDISDGMLVSGLKELIAKELADTPVASQRLIFAGRILKDGDSLASYNIVEGSTVHMVKSGAKKPAEAARGSAIPDDTVVSSQPAAAAAAPAASVPAVSVPEAMGGLGGMGAMGGMGGMGDMASMFGMGGMGGGGGGMPQMSPEMMEQMYSNPMVQQMMSQLSANPELLRTMIESNPMIQQQLTPQMRSMLDNPEFLRMATNPDVMRATAQMQAAMQQMQGGGGSGGGMYNPWAQSAPPAQQPAQHQAAQQQPQQPPEERFRQQLQQLNDMGFWNAAQNIRALSMTGGNVEAAIEFLLSNPGN